MCWVWTSRAPKERLNGWACCAISTSHRNAFGYDTICLRRRCGLVQTSQTPTKPRGAPRPNFAHRDGAGAWSPTVRQSFGATNHRTCGAANQGRAQLVENEVAACRRCNSARGHRTLGDWSVACMERGWTPNIVLILRRLDELEQEIQRKGGIRRARPYIRAQRRRLSLDNWTETHRRKCNARPTASSFRT